MSEWQPIETAPKDGTRILVVNGHFMHFGEMAVSYWETMTSIAGRKYGWWDLSGYDGYDAGPEIEPTHWMPLPEPPKP